MKGQGCLLLLAQLLGSRPGACSACCACCACHCCRGRRWRSCHTPLLSCLLLHLLLFLSFRVGHFVLLKHNRHLLLKAAARLLGCPPTAAAPAATAGRATRRQDCSSAQPLAAKARAPRRPCGCHCWPSQAIGQGWQLLILRCLAVRPTAAATFGRAAWRSHTRLLLLLALPQQQLGGGGCKAGAARQLAAAVLIPAKTRVSSKVASCLHLSLPLCLQQALLLLSLCPCLCCLCCRTRLCLLPRRRLHRLLASRGGSRWCGHLQQQLRLWCCGKQRWDGTTAVQSCWRRRLQKQGAHLRPLCCSLLPPHPWAASRRDVSRCVASQPALHLCLSILACRRCCS